jgi:hypothetical protein
MKYRHKVKYSLYFIGCFLDISILRITFYWYWLRTLSSIFVSVAKVRSVCYSLAEIYVRFVYLFEFIRVEGGGMTS